MAKKSSDKNDDSKRPPDGLISRLRESAASLIFYLHANQRHKTADPTIDLSEELQGGARKLGKQGPTYWPVSIAGWTQTKDGGYDSKGTPAIDGKDSPVIPELKPICNILRRQASFVEEDVLYDDRPVGLDGLRFGPAQHHYEKVRYYDEYDEADLVALKNALSLPTTSVQQGSVGHAVYRPWYLSANASPLRTLADMLMDFTFLLVSDYGMVGKRPVYGLHDYNPIAVCQHCNGLFLRTRADGQFCSKKCGASHWRLDRKEYLRNYQAKWRSGLKEETERLKKKIGDDKPRRSSTAKKKQKRSRLQKGK